MAGKGRGGIYIAAETFLGDLREVMRERRSVKNSGSVECIASVDELGEQKVPRARAGRYRRAFYRFSHGPLFLRRLSFQSHRDGGRRPKSFRERKTREDDDGAVDRWW